MNVLLERSDVDRLRRLTVIVGTGCEKNGVGDNRRCTCAIHNRSTAEEADAQRGVCKCFASLRVGLPAPESELLRSPIPFAAPTYSLSNELSPL